MAENRILLWSRDPKDTDGYICMPTKEHIPKGRPNWTPDTCPKCGAACWRRPGQEEMEKSGAVALCTGCALKMIHVAGGVA